jgi:hypothetical protein
MGTTAGPAAPPPAATAPAPSGDPFASLGGGIPTAGGGWVPPGMVPGTGTPQSPGNPATNPPAAPPAAPGAPGTPTTPTGAPLATNAAQISAPFYQTLHGILSQSQPVTEDDPMVKNQINAARSQEERNFAKQRQMMAERAAAEGTNMSGGFDAMLGEARAGIGARLGAQSADAVRQLQTERMSQIMTALSLAGTNMTEGDRNQLQRELAELDASLRREGLGLEKDQLSAGKEESAAERALRKYIADQGSGFNYAQLGQQGEQFGQNLSATVGMNEAQLNQALILALLQGGE